MICELGVVQVESQLYHPALFSQHDEWLDSVPQVPVLPATRSRLQHLLQDSCISLRDVSDAILSDPGATLHVLRLTTEEFSREEGRPTLIPDCIASLGVQRCYEVICSSDSLYERAVTALWERSRRVAECMKDLTEYIDGVSPAQAYLVGLLHGIGKLPALLCWPCATASAADEAALGAMLARSWQLPPYLQKAMNERRDAVGSHCWSELLQVAEQLASEPEDAIPGITQPSRARVSHQLLMMS